MYRRAALPNITENTPSSAQGNHGGRKSHRGDSNLVFDELHRRVLKIQLIAQPHEERSKLVLSQSDVPVLCMVPGNQNNSVSQTVGLGKRTDRLWHALCSVLGKQQRVQSSPSLEGKAQN